VPADDTATGGTKDVTLLTSSQVGGITTLTFSRPLVTPDANKDQPITMANANNLFLQWAWADTDGTVGPPLNYITHPLTAQGGGGAVQVNFFTGGITAPSK
jgi:hypothetical protein